MTTPQQDPVVLMANQAWQMCVAVVVVGLTGCDSRPYDLAPVSGVVTLDGAPIAGTVVNYQPIAKDGKAPGPGSVGRCDKTGRYVLKTIDDESGAVVGTHRVRIYSYSPESPAPQDSDQGPPREQFPERYNYRSRLTIEVKSDGTETADFELKTSE